MTEKIRILVYNREYEINASGLTPLEASALAQYVSDKMKEIADQTNTVDTAKLAVLAALNITDELLRLRQSKSQDTGHLDYRIDDLVSLLDTALSYTVKDQTAQFHN